MTTSEEGLYESVDAGGGHGLLEPIQAGVQPPLVPQHGRAQPGEPRVQSGAAAVVVQQGDLDSLSSLELETKVHLKVRNHGEGPY